MGVLERLEEQRRYEIHQRKLGHAKPVIKTRDGGPALAAPSTRKGGKDKKRDKMKGKKGT